MKKVLSVLLIVSLLVGFSSPLYADYESIIPGNGVSVVDGLSTAYEASVIARMAGRAGAATESGAKGIAFEIIYSDVKNFFYNIFTGITTKLSPNSIDSVADLISTDKNGAIVELIQCKDGTSPAQINKVLSNITNGKYEGAELVGTHEFVEIYNEQAIINGVAPATDSGISTKFTSQIADKALGKVASVSDLAGLTLKASGLAAGITAVFSIADSVFRGDSVADATGKVICNSSISASSVAVGSLSKAGINSLLLSIGANTAVATASSAIVGILVPLGASYVLYLIVEEAELQDAISTHVAPILQSMSTTMGSVKNYFTNMHIAEKASFLSEKVVSTFQSIPQSASAWINEHKAQK